MEYYYSFSDFLKKYFKGKIYKISVDAGFSCPNRDGTISRAGCLYCNNSSFVSERTLNQKISVKEQIEKNADYFKKRYRAEKFLIYFQPFTNTYGPLKKLKKIYTEALSCPDVAGLVIGTRPDCIDEEKINLLGDLSKKHFICLEYGLQSIYDKSLKFINRGHTYKDFLNALQLTINRGIFIGTHIILGFPTETKCEMLKMAEILSKLPINFLKIHQLQIIKDTPLAEIYKNSPFPVWDYDDYLNFLVKFIERLNPNIVIQRFFSSDATGKLLMAPLWEKTKYQIQADICRKFEENGSFQGKKWKFELRRESTEPIENKVYDKFTRVD